ncbi:MAG: hypothetical protein ACJ760_15170 [Thermoleophilaceae bacterium]
MAGGGAEATTQLRHARRVSAVEIRVLARATALGLLTCLALTGQVAAELAPRLAAPPYSRLAGPVFAGDATVWGKPANNEYDVFTQRGQEQTITRVDVPRLSDEGADAHIEASDRRVVLGLVGAGHSAVLTGPPGGDLTQLAGSEACPARSAVDVYADVVTYEDCTGLHVRDLATGASPAGRDYPDRRSARVAGSYVAARSSDGTTVANWRTGDDLYSIATPEDFDVQAGGKLAYHDLHRVLWASPEEPFEHQAFDYYSFTQEVRMVGDRIAARFDYPADDVYGPYGGYTFDALELADPGPDYTPRLGSRDAIPRLDFDGTRVMYADASCRHAWLVIEEPGVGRTSGDVPHDCPFPSVVRGPGRIDAERHLRLRLRCDAPPGPACVGWIRRVGRHRKPLTFVRYSIAQRHAKTVHFPAKGFLCRQRRHHARAWVMLERTGSKRILTVPATGPTKGLPKC